ncbi:MAG: hypothetical protein ACTSVA_04340 [Candidatus Njordarchaeales archaeon]
MKALNFLLDIMDAISFTILSTLDDERIPPKLIKEIVEILRKVSDACEKKEKKQIIVLFLELMKISQELFNLLPLDEREVVEENLDRSQRQLERVLNAALKNDVTWSTINCFARGLLEELLGGYK